jgi:hypothetical protein
MEVAPLTPLANGAIAPGTISPPYRLPDGAAIRFIEDAERHDKASAIARAPRFVRIIKARISRPANKNMEFGFECARFFPDELRAEWKDGLFPNPKESAELDVEHEVRDPQNPAILLDKYTFRRFYEAYKDSKRIAETGTPLEIWGVLNPAQIATLKYQDITTVEALAGINDAQLAAIGMGGRAMREQARAYIVATTGSAAQVQAVVARVEKLESAVTSKDEEIAQLRAALAAATSTKGAAPAPADEPPPSPPVRRGGRKAAAKPDNIEDDVAATLRDSVGADEDPDYV